MEETESRSERKICLSSIDEFALCVEIPFPTVFSPFLSPEKKILSFFRLTTSHFLVIAIQRKKKEKRAIVLCICGFALLFVLLGLGLFKNTLQLQYGHVRLQQPVWRRIQKQRTAFRMGYRSNPFCPPKAEPFAKDLFGRLQRVAGVPKTISIRGRRQSEVQFEQRAGPQRGCGQLHLQVPAVSRHEGVAMQRLVGTVHLSRVEKTGRCHPVLPGGNGQNEHRRSNGRWGIHRSVGRGKKQPVTNRPVYLQKPRAEVPAEKRPNHRASDSLRQ